jgi:hypothetical protein
MHADESKSCWKITQALLLCRRTRRCARCSGRLSGFHSWVQCPLVVKVSVSDRCPIRRNVGGQPFSVAASARSGSPLGRSGRQSYADQSLDLSHVAAGSAGCAFAEASTENRRDLGHRPVLMCGRRARGAHSCHEMNARQEDVGQANGDELSRGALE